MTDLDKAREWVEGVHRTESECGGVRKDALAAAELIQSLPDRWIDAEKLREALEGCDKMTYPYEVIEHIEKTLLTPPLQTLADMNEDDRHALVGKDVKVEGWNNPSMLVAVHKDEGAVLGHRWVNPWPFVEVRPLSELSLSLSGESEAVSVETEDVTEEGRTALPRPEDVPAEEPWIVEYEDREWVGVRKSGTGSFPWSLASMDGRTRDCAFDSVIALVSRLVPGPVVKTLRTVEDYEDAAVGTVVRRQALPWLAATFHKCVDGIWNSTGGYEYPFTEMAGTARTVLWEPKP